MYNYDQILASAYYVFRGELTTTIIASMIIFLKKNGVRLKRQDLKMKELARIMTFDNHKFYLKSGYKLEDIHHLINDDLVRIFLELQKIRDLYYSNLGVEKVLKKGKK